MPYRMYVSTNDVGSIGCNWCTVSATRIETACNQDCDDIEESTIRRRIRWGKIHEVIHCAKGCAID